MSCQAAVNEFLSGLPSRDPDNFQKWTTDSSKQNVTRRPTTYVQTKEIPSQQVIVTEKTSILLRYLHQQFEKKSLKNIQKRDSNQAQNEDDIQRKRPRLE